MSENDQVATYLRVEAVEAVYDVSILALRGVTFGVSQASVTALLGANGAGKTTTLRAISNLLGAGRGSVRRGPHPMAGAQYHGDASRHPREAGPRTSARGAAVLRPSHG